jgi:hypothetical protein
MPTENWYAPASADYDRRVFVNCPFDEAYTPLLHALIFTIHDLGFVARHALIDDHNAIRITRIRCEARCNK